MNRQLIVNALIVNEGHTSESDLLIVGDRIEKIGKNLSASPADTVIDAQGLHLIPGMIDGQVHFREPGDGLKGTIASESKAAIVGGITSFMEMPNTNPPTVTIEALQEKYARASGRAYANYAFYLGATNDNLDQLSRLKPNDACAIKIFMGASTGNMLVDNPATLAGFFERSPILIATHCEDTPMILHQEAQFKKRYAQAVSADKHPQIRSEQACYRSSSMAVSLAKDKGTRLHVLHLTTAKEMALFACGAVCDKLITAEACVHHLWFDDSDYARLGMLIKCNPAIKRRLDRDALRQAVKDDVIDVIATDHAPHTWEEKQQHYFLAPSGLPLVQHALLSLLDQVVQGQFSLEQIVHKTSHAVAQCYRVQDRGYVREGYFADLVLVDLQRTTQVTPDSLYYGCGWSPFMDQRFQARICRTWVNGISVWDGQQVRPAPVGQRLVFDHRW